MTAPRRILARAAGYFALGLLTTVAVAWAFAFVDIDRPVRNAVRLQLRFSYVDAPPHVADYPGSIYTQAHIRPGTAVFHGSANGPGYQRPGGYRFFDHDPQQTEAFDALIPSWAIDEVVPWINNPALRPKGGDELSRSVSMAGWPLLCLYSRELGGTGIDIVIEGGMTLPSRFMRRVGSAPVFVGLPVTIPYLPHYPSLAGNVMFYASAWFGVLTVGSFATRRFRRRRNLCPRCAYSLTNLPPGAPCPECGHTQGN